MPKRLAQLFLALLFTSTFSLNAVAQPSVRTVNLDTKIATAAPDELFRVLIGMDSQRTFSSSEVASMRLAERQVFVAQEVIAHAEQSQQHVLRVLRRAERQGHADDIRSIAIANVISARVTRSVVEEIELLQGIRRIDHDGPQSEALSSDNAVIPLDSQTLLDVSRLHATPLWPITGSLPEWGVAKINAPQLWNRGIRGDGTLVAVIDSGCDFGHPDIANQLWDPVDQNGNTLWFDVNNDGTQNVGETLVQPGWNTVEDNNKPCTNCGTNTNTHGQNVAGIIVGNGAEGKATGVAPDARLLCIRGIPDGGGTQADMMEAVDFLLRMKAQWLSDFEMPDVVNMSAGSLFAGIPDYAGWRTISDRLLSEGVLFVAAGGDTGTETGGDCSRLTDSSNPIPYNIQAPANVPPPWLHPNQPTPAGSGPHVSAVLAVGAVDQSDQRWSYSSRGPSAWEDIRATHSCQDDMPPAFRDFPQATAPLLKPDVVGPSDPLAGSTLHTTGLCTSPTGALQGSLCSDPYETFGGTSAATPHVAGVVLLMNQVKPDLSPAEVAEAIQMSAIHPNHLPGQTQETHPIKDNFYGAGRIDAYAAVKYVLEHFGGTLPQDFTIPIGETWDIQPGVTVTFAPGARLLVQGTLNADGATFAAADPAQGWGGIRFLQGSAGLFTDVDVREVNSPGVNHPGATIYVHNADPIFEGLFIDGGFGEGVIVNGSQADVHIRDSANRLSEIRDLPHRSVVSANGADVYLDRLASDNTGSVGIYAKDADIFIRLSEINGSDQWAARAYDQGRVLFGFEDSNAPSGQNNLLQESGTGTLFGLLGSTIYAGGAGSIFSNSFRNNWFRRNGPSPNEKHIRADGSDIVAECNYWDRTLGPDPAHIQISNGGVFDPDPFLSSPPGPSVSCSSIGITSEDDPTSYMRTGNTTAAARSGKSVPGLEEFPRLDVGGPPKGMAPERWFAIVQGAENPDRGVGISHAINAIQRARTPDEERRAFEVATQLGRNTPHPGLEGFLVEQSRISKHRPLALSALASIYYGIGRADEAQEAALALTTEFAGTDHARRGWTSRFALAVDAGDVESARAAVQTLEARWPEGDGFADLRYMLQVAETSQLSETDRPVGSPRTAQPRPKVASETALPMMTELQAPYPNPTTGRFTVPLALAEEAEVTLTLVNTLGQRVRSHTPQQEAAGVHAYDVDTVALAAGVYVVQVSVTGARGTQQFHRTLTVVR
ncbi:MAG: S8 family serine peptidase [Bacteroidota bacterium]